MLDGFTIGDTDEVRFLLTSRRRSDGQFEIVLRLYRDSILTSATTVSTVRENLARIMMLGLRMQLFRLGFGEHAPRLPAAAGLQSG